MEALLNGQCASQSLGPANQLFALLVQTILAAQCTISPPDMWPKDYGPTALAKGLDEYDFVIVGAGSAGSVVANRLSENPEWKVLLLEAGGDPPIESEIPFLQVTLQKSPFDWIYHADSRNKLACRASPRGCFWPRGKMLGGSGAMNAMIYMRGNPRDYDSWEARGNEGWGWRSALRYFRKSEDNRDARVVGDGKYHGTGGYLAVTSTSGDSLPLNQFEAAAQEAGYPRLVDSNANKHIGFGRIQLTTVDGTRCSPAKAFLVPAKDRANLHVIKNALATKIEFDGKKRASTVKFTLNGGDQLEVRVKREAIVSAGAVNTPQLLMLSGIGREKDLRKHRIPLISNLPVGRKMEDHITVPVFYKLFRSTTTDSDPLKDTMARYYEYLTNRTGQLTGNGMLGFNGFVNTINRSDPYPNVQYHYIHSPKRMDFVSRWLNSMELGATLNNIVAAANAEADVLAILTILVKPKSWGHVRLQTTKPQDKPHIEAGYLYHREDVRALVGGIRVQQNIMATRAAKLFEPQLLQVELAACQAEEYDSDGYWECYIRELTLTLYHPVGTAKMGPEGDPDAVVDARLRVHGVRGLRVVDASVMPEIVSGNTNAPVMMIAEKASDMLKQDNARNAAI